MAQKLLCTSRPKPKWERHHSSARLLMAGYVSCGFWFSRFCFFFLACDSLKRYNLLRIFFPQWAVLKERFPISGQNN